MKTISLVPAYGRDYKSEKEVEEAFDKGKDFRIMDISNPWDGKYASKSELTEYRQVRIRYNKLQDVMFIRRK